MMYSHNKVVKFGTTFNTFRVYAQVYTSRLVVWLVRTLAGITTKSLGKTWPLEKFEYFGCI